jgi:hypothetical protein
MIDAGFTLDLRQDKLYVALTSTAANVWMMEPAPEPR